MTVYDRVNSAWQQRWRFAGNSNPISFTSISNQMKVVFRTDGSVTRKGFKATVNFGKLWAHKTIKSGYRSGFSEWYNEYIYIINCRKACECQN